MKITCPTCGFGPMTEEEAGEHICKDKKTSGRPPLNPHWCCEEHIRRVNRRKQARPAYLANRRRRHQWRMRHDPEYRLRRNRVDREYRKRKKAAGVAGKSGAVEVAGSA